MKRDWHDFDAVEEDQPRSWYGDSNDDCWLIRDQQDEIVAHVYGDGSSNMDKDIYLLAAAPEMLAALERILELAAKPSDNLKLDLWRIQVKAQSLIKQIEKAQA